MKLYNLEEFEASRPICSQCKEKCATVEECFDYAGTHSTNGKSGTHRTGHYVSECCLEEVEYD